MKALNWILTHPMELAAIVALLRGLYALISRLVAPHPRLRAVVEGLAALAPDALRAAQQLGSALLGRPLPSLDARAPEDDRAALRAQVAQLESIAVARAARILELEREVIAARGGSPTRTPGVQ